MDIKYHFLHRVTLSKRNNLRAFIEQIFINEKIQAKSLNIIFCDDEYLLSINRRFLKHDYYTDIVSFKFNIEKLPLQAELYISVSRVKENAKHYKTLQIVELHRVIFHGILHFCGYDDKKQSDVIRMRNREDYYLKKFLVSRET